MQRVFPPFNLIFNSDFQIINAEIPFTPSYLEPCSKVNNCILHANTHQRSFLRYKDILFFTVLRMVKVYFIYYCTQNGQSFEHF